LFGVGEAIFGTLGPALLSDYYFPKQRNIVMSIFYSATPIGCALGYIVAGMMGQYLGWRMTCIYLGMLGIVSIVLLFVREPTVGEKDIDEHETFIINENVNSNKTLFNRIYIFTVLGFIAVTFGMGCLSDWLPVFFQRYYGMSSGKSGFISGGIVVIGGLFGSILGGLLSDLTEKYVTKRHVYFLIPGIAILFCSLFATLALYCFPSVLIVVLIMFGFAVFFGSIYIGPINTIIQNSVHSEMRPMANGVSTLFIHLFGDAISPTIVGFISDHTSENLRIALILVPISMGIAGIIWLIGWCIVPKKK
jgi:MFS transporter, Spinster family, sphingosine-1-phosphate transporter